jgi:hypothetical protein
MNYKDFLEEYEKLMDSMRDKVDVPTFLNLCIKTCVSQAYYCAPSKEEAIKLIDDSINEGYKMFEDNA